MQLCVLLDSAQAGRERLDLAAGLVKHGLTAGAHVGLYSINCPEWVLMDAALLRQGMVSVPLYDTLGKARPTSLCRAPAAACYAQLTEVSGASSVIKCGDWCSKGSGASTRE